MTRTELVDSATALLGRTTATQVVEGVAIFFISLFASMVVATIVLCRLPADYLVRDPHDRPRPSGPAWIRLLRVVGKNLLGAVLVLLGVLLSIPGIPGQGVLTILIGVLLLDIPGKHALERRMLARPKILETINRIRVRFRKEPLVAPTLPPSKGQ